MGVDESIYLSSLCTEKKTSLTLGVAYDGAVASLHGSGASAHCPAWHGLRPARDRAIGDSHGLRAP